MKTFSLLLTGTLLLTSLNTSAQVNPTCPDYLEGLSNPDIIRFGGSEPNDPRTPVQAMANLLLSYVPSESPDVVQVAIPTFLEFNAAQEQFGDGQKNGFASFGPLPKEPFVAVLTRKSTSKASSELAFLIDKDLIAKNKITQIEISVDGTTQVIALDQRQMVRIPVKPQDLGWDQQFNAKSVFFRPLGWSDWFTVSFPNAYTSIEKMMAGMEPAQKTLPTGQSILDPLNLKGAKGDPQISLREAGDSTGFVLSRTERSTRVHGTYIAPQGAKLAPVGSTTLTSTGGVWTRYRLGAPFKIVYLDIDPRVVDIEREEGVVSGTGPHYIGATGEIILNSLGSENLMTFYGIPNPDKGPDGNQLAWGFTHQWVGTWLKPGDAFVTPQGLYHWHPTHLNNSIAAEVLTPPHVPTAENHSGFTSSK